MEIKKGKKYQRKTADISLGYVSTTGRVTEGFLEFSIKQKFVKNKILRNSHREREEWSVTV